MTAKEYLNQIKILEARIETITSEIKSIRNEIGNLRATWPDGQPHGSGKSNPVEAEAIRLADKLTKLEEDEIKTRSQLWSRRTAIIGQIGKVPDELSIRVLHSRYVDGDSFEQIAVDIGYSYRQTLRKHGEALERFRKVMSL